MKTRLIALKCLIKILENNQNATEAVDFYITKAENTALFTNLVSGTVKQKLTIDYFIEKLSTRKLKKISPPVKNIIRLAIFEIEYMEKPEYATINSYVELVKNYEKNSIGFVNAILRNFIRKRAELTFPKLEDNPVKSISIEFSHPEWLIDKWIKNYGVENTIKICKFDNTPPKLVLKINPLRTTKDEMMKLLKENDIEFSESTIVKESLILNRSGKISNIPGYKEGFWSIQGEASSLVAEILQPKEDEQILDVCAAPGGKTANIACLMKDTGKIIALDINKIRLKKVTKNAKRLGLTSVKRHIADAKTYLADIKFDRILIDAPCSNTGVLGKRIDARWNKTQEDIEKLATLQYDILNNIAKSLKKGGVIVYSTCSIEPEENLNIIKRFLEENKEFKLSDFATEIPFSAPDKGFVQILPSEHNIDGFFIAKLEN